MFLSPIWLKLAFIFDPVQRFFNGNFWEVFIKKFGLFEGKKVLDIACGTGQLRSYINPQKYLGIDINTSYVNYAKNFRKFPNSKFILTDAIKHRLKERYDVAFLISATHHLSENQLKNLCQSLKQNQVKKMIIVDGIPIGPLSKLLKWLDATLGGGKYFRSLDQLREIVGSYLRITHLGIFDTNSLFYNYQYLITTTQNPKKINTYPVVSKLSTPKLNLQTWVLPTILVFLTFFLLFIMRAFSIMQTAPFYDFDEAHRAENAKRMKEYNSLIVPLTGSPFDRVTEFRVPYRENPNLFLYYHLERPTFIYWLMMISTNFFGSSEFAYRLPSFILGLSTFLVLGYFIKALETKINFYAFAVSFLALATSADLWLSSQYAQLDTGLTVFLLFSLLSLIHYCKKRKTLWLAVSGLSFAFAVLSKGQPAVILIFPILFLVITKKLSFRDLIKFLIFVSIILVPWLYALAIKFGLLNVIKIFSGFAISSAITEYLHHQAPFFWYARWWWESLRPGWTLFLAFLVVDILNNNLSWQKKTLLSFIIGGFIFYSLAINKIWWYVLPLVPAMAFYLYFSVYDYLNSGRSKFINLSLVILFASLPFLIGVTNKVSMLYGIGVSILVLFILTRKITINNSLHQPWIFLFCLTAGLLLFYLRFPEVVPYHWNTKEVAGFFSQLPGKKCLYIKDMPTEAALFYSNAGEIITYNKGMHLLPDCQNYLITPSQDIEDMQVIYQRGDMKLIKMQK